MVQNFPGAPNGARKGLKPLIWGLFRREAAKFFWGIFAKNPEIRPNVRKKTPPLVIPDLATRGGLFSNIWGFGPPEAEILRILGGVLGQKHVFECISAT